MSGGDVMPSDTVSARLPDVVMRSDHQILVLVRRLVVTTVLSGLGYSLLTTASRGWCPGGIASDGSFVDRFGNTTEFAPACINLTLGPSPVVFLVLALVVLWAVTRVCRNPQDEAAALRDLTRAAGGVVVLTVLAVVLTTAAFSSISLESWDGSTVPQLPGWLAVDVTITPMQTG